MSGVGRPWARDRPSLSPSAAHSAAAGGNCQSSRAPSRRAVAYGPPGAQVPSGFQAQGGGLCLGSAAGRCTAEHRPETMAPSRCQNREMRGPGSLLSVRSTGVSAPHPGPPSSSR